MIHIQNLHKKFGTKVIFDAASAHIPPRTRVGLVGPNGSGKTTLLRMLIGEETPDAGEIVISRGKQIGYLKQEVWQNPERSVLAETLAGYPELQQMELQLNALEQVMAETPSPELLRQYGKLQSAFEARGGYRLESEAKSILSGIGFTPAQFLGSLAALSGGWLMRVALARLLLARPDILLLDEPTNHLDLESVVWLESFLMDYPGTIVLTSHDQVFMQSIANRILEIERGKLVFFTGSFEAFAEAKAQAHEHLEAAYRNQQKKIVQTERFIERFRYKATKARQVQSRIKQLEKLETITPPAKSNRNLQFRLPQPERSGKVVVTLAHLAKAYGSKQVYTDVNLIISRGQKIALLGANGAGKSTLLKMIAGAIDCSAGTITYGHNVTLEYYAQHQLEVLDATATIYEEFSRVTSHLTPQQRRTILGAFLFSADEVFKKIGVLSGGEKARVALAKLLARPANLLVMDEPTNHLDILSRQVLEEALADYEGTLVFISHDRAFINAIANHVIEIRDGQLWHFPGNYDDYQWRKQSRLPGADAGLRPANAAPAGGEGDTPANRKDLRRQRALQVQEKSKLLKPLQTSAAALETDIAALEAEKDDLTRQICDPKVMADARVYPQKLKQHAEVVKRLEASYRDWETLMEQIEQIEARFAANLPESD